MVITAVIFLILGILLVTYLIQESHTEEKILDAWNNIYSKPLTSENAGPSWTLNMPEGSFFDLNVSSSDTVRIRIGKPRYNNDTGEPVLVLIGLIFNEAGTRFTQKVVIDVTDTYEIEIKNEGANAVIIGGDVSARQIVTTYRTVHPYLSLGTPVILTGLISLIYGIFFKPKKRAR